MSTDDDVVREGQTPAEEANQDGKDEFGSVMSAIGQQARRLDAAHLPKGEVNALSWKRLEQVIMQMLGPYVGTESRALMGDIAQIELRLGNINNANQQLEQLIQEAEAEIAEAQAEYERLKAEADAANAEARRRIEEMEAEADRLLKEAEQLEDECRTREEGFDARRRQIAELQDKRALLQHLTDVEDPARRVRELEEVIAGLTELRLKMLLELDVFDLDEVHDQDEPFEERVAAVNLRVAALSRTSDEALQGTRQLEELNQDALERYRRARSEIDRLVRLAEEGHGSTDTMAEFVRARARVDGLRDQVALVEQSVDLLETAGPALQEKFG